MAHWTPESIRLLGTDLDGRIAARLGLSKPQVRRQRQALKIAPFRKSKTTWAPAELALLGTDLDQVIARKLGLKFAQVHWKRTQLGIPAYTLRHLRPWKGWETRLLGSDTDTRLARRLNRGKDEVRKARLRQGIAAYGRLHVWTREENSLLGAVSDGVVAQQLGLTRAEVANQRHRLGIPGRRNRQHRYPASLTLADEELRAIPGFPGYYASAQGNVFSMRGKGVPLLLQYHRQQHGGGWQTRLRDPRGRKVHLSVIRAILLAWRGRPPRGKTHAIVLDGNFNHLNLANLAWGTLSQIARQRAARRPGDS